MNVLVTGANGLLGQKLMALISAQKHTAVHGIGRGKDRNLNPHNHVYHSGDLTINNDIERAFEEAQPDVVIHTAAMTQVDECEEEPQLCRQLNIEVVRNLAEKCRESNAHLIHTSTDFIFDGKSGPYKETDDPNPLNEYGKSKWASEQLLVEMDGLSYGIARTILVYGKVNQMTRSNIVLWLKTALENETAIKLVDDQWRSPTLAEDLAMGCWLMAQQRAKGVFHLSGPDIVTPYDIGITTAQVFDLPTRLISRANSQTFKQKAKRPPKTGFILDKAKDQLGYLPHSLLDGLKALKSQLS